MPELYLVGKTERVFGHLIPLTTIELPAGRTLLDLVKLYSYTKDYFPPQVYPFEIGPGGDSLCFDYRTPTEHGPQIVYWEHESTDDDKPEDLITYVCDTFTELLGMLYESDDDDD